MLTQRSGCEVGVEYVGDERMTVDSVDAWLGERAASGADLVVVALGLNDALRLTPVGRFADRYRALVLHLRAQLPAEAQVLLLGVPHPRSYSMAGGFLGRVAERHADRLTAGIRAAGEGLDRVHVADALFEHFDPAAPLGSPGFFRDLAEQLADLAAPLLARASTERHRPHGASTPTAAQVLAEREDEVLDALVRRTKEEFGVAAAAVNLIDGDRVLPAAQTGGVPVQMPRSLAYCGVVADTRAALLVPDADREERFRGNPFLDVVQLPYYAGVPLHRPDGSVVGTLCILDPTPRPADSSTLPRLRLLAKEAESRLASSAPAAPAVEPLLPA